ncbi:MAG: hypothetical protein JWO38_3087 [Gemmataceae bacterium]|nr:hypothetical protein [Gemmataceae bacterium]
MMADESEELTLDQRRSVFVALVEAQDEGLGVRDSRAAVARKFGVDVERVCEIEEEGLAGNWPPFGRG